MSRSIHRSRRAGLAHAFLCCLAFVMTLFASGCDLFGQDDSFDVPPERLVALTAVYAETDAGGAPIQRIVLLDYDDPSHYKVVTDAVTNLDGSFYREYTSGEFIDDHPRWGPGGKTILFDRRALFDFTFTRYRLMEVNLETGAVREFARPEVFGAVALRFPDY